MNESEFKKYKKLIDLSIKQYLTIRLYQSFTAND